MNEILIYGLTGNMGCGKSTVAKFFGEFKDVVVFDADRIAKELLCEKQYSRQLLKLLGPKAFSDSKIDLRKVAQLVFDDYQLLEKLEKFIHPLTWQFICEKIKSYSGISFFLVEGALIYEAGWQKFFDAVIVVTCDQTSQYHRLRNFKGLSNEEIAKRLGRQLPAEEKVKNADFVIDTTYSSEEVKKNVQRLYPYLKGGVKNEQDHCLPRHL